jgi:multiple sugar transport system ATP-binding protein
MTMADRIVLLRDGVVQQIASPQEMYDHPTNIFVAGFIGSPAMNFVQAWLEKDDGGLTAVFGKTRVSLSQERIQLARDIERYVGKELILGIRPEDIEDAAHIEDVRLDENRQHASTLEVKPEVIESMGSEKYVYFEMPRELTAYTQTIEEMEQQVGRDNDTEDDSGELLVARVSPESEARKGETVKLIVDGSKVHLFDSETEEAIL